MVYVSFIYVIFPAFFLPRVNWKLNQIYSTARVAADEVVLVVAVVLGLHGPAHDVLLARGAHQLPHQMLLLLPVRAGNQVFTITETEMTLSRAFSWSTD